jgi:hypothetical protein
MCGRFTQRYAWHEIHDLYGLASVSQFYAWLGKKKSSHIRLAVDNNNSRRQLIKID